MPWSDWQDPYEMSVAVSRSGYYRNTQLDDYSGSPGGDLPTIIDGLKSDINTGGGTLTEGGGPQPDTLTRLLTGSGLATTASLALGYAAQVFDAATAEGFLPPSLPPALSGLVYGIQYGPIPDSALPTAHNVLFDLIDLETAGTTWESWLTFSGAVDIGLTNFPGTIFPATIPLRLSVTGSLADTALGDAVAGPVLPYGGDATLIDLDPDTPPASFLTTEATFDVDVSGLSLSKRFTAMVQTRFQGADTLPSDGASNWELTIDGLGSGQPSAMHLSPRWRYWIPDAVYTVGGHWATPSGVQVMSLKGDGVTWIPVVDGLAPPLR